MFWPILTLLALAALVLQHVRWRRRLAQAQSHVQTELGSWHEQVRRQALEFQTQQETLFDSMSEGVLVLDADNRIQVANRAFRELFATTPELRGKTVLEVVRRHELQVLLEKVAAEKQVLDYELNAGGLSERWLQINAGAIFSGDKKQGSLLVFHDLTRIKQLERTREEFVANVSHELRTPLSLIKGYVETLIDGAKDNPEVCARFLQTIRRNAERLQFLIEDLLTISELESGRLTMNLRPVQLKPFVERLLEDFKPQADAKRISVLNEVPDLGAQADAERLHQVLANLIDNAIKYGRCEGRVRITGRPSDGMIEVCIADDGPGIPSESLERVFERFYRVDKARSRDQGGTGLGLSIVKHIVQGHGGRVWAKSEPGRGAAFYFTLPAADQAGANSPHV